MKFHDGSKVWGIKVMDSFNRCKNYTFFMDEERNIPKDNAYVKMFLVWKFILSFFL